MSLAPRTGEHWLDRLAAPHTRRQGIKAALAAFALTLPVGRPRLAWAGNPNGLGDAHACQKGCFYASHRSSLATINSCYKHSRGFYRGGMAAALLISPYLGLVQASTAMIAFEICSDAALIAQKDRNHKCLEPNCPGFEPAADYGPCVNCASIPGCQCCPDSSSSTGYTYCSSLSGRCCAPGGGCRNCTG